MDMREASAMTEASRLVDEKDGIDRTSEARRRPLQQPSQDVARVHTFYRELPHLAAMLLLTFSPPTAAKG